MSRKSFSSFSATAIFLGMILSAITFRDSFIASRSNFETGIASVSHDEGVAVIPFGAQGTRFKVVNSKREREKACAGAQTHGTDHHEPAISMG